MGSEKGFDTLRDCDLRFDQDWEIRLLGSAAIHGEPAIPSLSRKTVLPGARKISATGP